MSRSISPSARGDSSRLAAGFVDAVVGGTSLAGGRFSLTGGKGGGTMASLTIPFEIAVALLM